MTKFNCSINGTQYQSVEEFVKALNSANPESLKDVKFAFSTEEKVEQKQEPKKADSLFDIINNLLKEYDNENKTCQNCTCKQDEQKKDEHVISEQEDQDNIWDYLIAKYILKPTTYTFKGKDDAEELDKFDKYLDDKVKAFKNDQLKKFLEQESIKDFLNLIMDVQDKNDEKSEDNEEDQYATDEDLRLLEDFIEYAQEKGIDYKEAQKAYEDEQKKFDILNSKHDYYNLVDEYYCNLRNILTPLITK